MGAILAVGAVGLIVATVFADVIGAGLGTLFYFMSKRRAKREAADSEPNYE